MLFIKINRNNSQIFKASTFDDNTIVLTLHFWQVSMKTCSLGYTEPKAGGRRTKTAKRNPPLNLSLKASIRQFQFFSKSLSCRQRRAVRTKSRDVVSTSWWPVLTRDFSFKGNNRKSWSQSRRILTGLPSTFDPGKPTRWFLQGSARVDYEMILTGLSILCELMVVAYLIVVHCYSRAVYLFDAPQRQQQKLANRLQFAFPLFQKSAV